jgi:hypothetical protein
MKPLVHAHHAERGRPWPVPRGDEPACDFESQTSSGGPAWDGPALGPECGTGD